MAPYRRLTRFAALVGATFVLAGCAFIGIDDAVMTTFEPAGPNARRLDDLFWMVFWIAAAVFVLVMAGLLYIMFRFRARKGDETAAEPKQLHGNAKLEVLWTVIPALILAGIAVPTVSGVFDLTGCEEDSMVVEIVGHQWWFEYYYPDHDILTANEMVIPVGQEVCAEMTSADVVHNYWVPALHGKRYMVPGQITELRLEADQTGEFWSHCAEFCGLSHSLMRSRVHVVTPDEFEAWIEEQSQVATFPEEETIEHQGYEVFVNRGCIQCHALAFDQDENSIDIPRDVFQGPDLTHFASRNTFAGSILPAGGETREEAIARWLADPPYIKPGSFMPNLALTSQEIDLLTAFLESLE